MKQSWLWKHVESRVGDRVRRMMRGNETGVAMLMALIFVVILIVTTTLVASVLIAQFAPYRRNTQNAQAAVVAENGLQSGLSYLREAEAGASSLLPSTTTDLSKASQDDEYTVDTTSSSGVKVVLNNASDTTSTTSTASTADYTTRNWTYSVTIQFYKDNPKDYTASELVSKALTPADFISASNVKYAAITSSAYFARYADGSRSDSVKPIRVIWSVYKFGVIPPYCVGGNCHRLGMGFYAAAPYSQTRWSGQPIWREIVTPKLDANKDLEGRTNYLNPISNSSDSISSTTQMNPANQSCMLATTKVVTKVESLNDMLDPTGMPQEGSALIVLPQAYKQNSGVEEYTYTPQCKPNGDYKKLNNWVYGKDDSIRPAADLTLCVTGLPISELSEKGPKNRIATLQKCGNSYGPNNQDDYYTNANVRDAEKRDPNSLLNKYQKWAFYNGFINAGYLNEISSESSKYDSALPESKGFSVGPISASAKTKFSHIEVSSKVALGSDLSNELSAGHMASNIQDFATLDPHFVVITAWDKNLGSAQAWYDVDGDMENATASFGQAGEAGHATRQIVNESSGFCITATSDGNDSYTDTCKVRGGDFDPFCYRNVITGKSLPDNKFGIGVSYYCPVSGNWDDSAKQWRWKTDQVEYNEDTSKDGSGVDTQLWTYTGADISTKKCYGFDGSAFKLMDCIIAPTFKRYNDKAKDEFTYGTFKLGGKCLTEIYPGDKVSGTAVYARSDGHPAITLEECGAATDYRGVDTHSQKWNATVRTKRPGGSADITGSNGFIFTRELTKDGSI